jgi:hypothetical protein
MCNPNPDLDDENSKTFMRYHFYISDVKTHDNYFVQHCLFLHWDDTINGGFRPKQHWIWSDGCGFRFKNKTPFYFVSNCPHLMGGCCLGHGKSPHEGASAVFKRFIKQAQLDVDGPQLQNAEPTVTLLCSRLKTSYSRDQSLVSCTFWHVKPVDVD